MSAVKERKDINRSTKTLRAILDASREAIVVADDDGEVVLVNAAAEALWNSERGEYVGRSVESLFSPHIAFMPLQFSPMCGGEVRVNAEGLSSDGDVFLVEVCIRRIEVDRQVFHLLSMDGDRATRDKQFTEVQEHTFSALERFASGLALEYNNILTGVIGNLELALDDYRRAGRPRQALLEAAHGSGMRARELTRSLLEFAKGEPSQRFSTNLEELVENNCLIALGNREIDAYFDFSKGLHAGFIDPNQVGQVFHRLLAFFAQSMDDSDAVRVCAVNELVEEDHPEEDLFPGDHVLLELTFEGLKLESQEIACLFEPFAKMQGKSNGLALAICRAIIGRQGGTISADFGEDGNLLIRIYIPASAEIPSHRFHSLDQPVMLEEGRLRILVMDDEHLVCGLLERALEGHDVTITHDGQDALDAYAESLTQGERYDLVLLDISVPSGMGARATCQELLQRDPLATCVVMSGDTSDEMMQDFEAFGFVGQLDKPLDLDSIAKLIDEHGGNTRGRFAQMLEEMELTEEDLALKNESNIVQIDFRPTDR